MTYLDRTTYRRVAAHVRDLISSGALRPGARVPTESDLVETFGVSRDTVRRGLQLLRNEGLIDVRMGHATRVREPMERRVVELRTGERVTARMATPAESGEVGEGVPMLDVVDLHGEVTSYPADETLLVAVAG